MQSHFARPSRSMNFGISIRDSILWRQINRPWGLGFRLLLGSVFVCHIFQAWGVFSGGVCDMPFVSVPHTTCSGTPYSTLLIVRELRHLARSTVTLPCPCGITLTSSPASNWLYRPATGSASRTNRVQASARSSSAFISRFFARRRLILVVRQRDRPRPFHHPT